MAFAPHANNARTIGENGLIIGSFDHADTGHYFEFGEREGDTMFPCDLNPEYPHLVYVGPHKPAGNMAPARMARVLRTVAYIVTDEGPNGEPIIEKWSIKRRRDYDVSDYR